MQHMNFGLTIRENRQRNNLSVQNLADKLGTTPGYISKIEVRGEIPNPDMIFKLANIFGMDAETLIRAAKDDKKEQMCKSIEKKFDNAMALYRMEKK
jgi:transcriptional regulator with XRE-family HTH domain